MDTADRILVLCHVPVARGLTLRGDQLAVGALSCLSSP